MGYRIESALADFIAKFTQFSTKEVKLVNKRKESSRADETSFVEPDLPNDMWQLHVDRASNHKGDGACVVIITPNGTLLEQVITLGFPASNNEAEYETLLIGRSGVVKVGHLFKFPAHHQSSFRRVHGKHRSMIQYLDKVQELLKAFSTFTIRKVPQLEESIHVVKANDSTVDVWSTLIKSTPHGMEHPLEEPRHQESEAQREVERVECDDPCIQIVRVRKSHMVR
ncbi:unnamed protein product [Prunus armeniaca]